MVYVAAKSSVVSFSSVYTMRHNRRTDSLESEVSPHAISNLDMKALSCCLHHAHKPAMMCLVQVAGGGSPSGPFTSHSLVFTTLRVPTAAYKGPRVESTDEVI